MSILLNQAPQFTAPAVVNGKEIKSDFSLSDYIGEKNIVLFFYPKDFTSICNSEIHAFQEKLDEFEKRDVQVIGVSTDSEDAHLAWLAMQGENGQISYPLVSDSSKTIAHNYGVLAGEWTYDEERELVFEGIPLAFRATFYINKEGVILHESVNFFTTGRNIDEILRTVDAIQHTENSGEGCNANWTGE